MKLRYFHLAIFPFSATCLVITPMRAELQLTSVITDHAVLQRDAPIHTVGEASPAEKTRHSPPPMPRWAATLEFVIPTRDLQFALMEKRSPEAIRPRHFRCARR